MADTATPTEVFRRQLDLLTSGRFADASGLYADDTVVRHMFGQQHTWHGRAELAEHFAGAKDLPFELKAVNVVVHRTDDPEVIVGEWDYDVRSTANGQTFRTGNLIVMRVRDGRIVESRDYHDPTGLAARLAN